MWGRYPMVPGRPLQEIPLLSPPGRGQILKVKIRFQTSCGVVLGLQECRSWGQSSNLSSTAHTQGAVQVYQRGVG